MRALLLFSYRLDGASLLRISTTTRLYTNLGDDIPYRMYGLRHGDKNVNLFLFPRQEKINWKTFFSCNQLSCLCCLFWFKISLKSHRVGPTLSSLSDLSEPWTDVDLPVVCSSTPEDLLHLSTLVSFIQKLKPPITSGYVVSRRVYYHSLLLPVGYRRGLNSSLSFLFVVNKSWKQDELGAIDL